MHSTYSDGSKTPQELIQEAKALGLSAIALTDHDTIEGLQEAMETGERLGVEVIPGLELSVEYGPGSMHILGLLINPEDKGLNDTLAKLQEGRSSRNPPIRSRPRRRQDRSEADPFRPQRLPGGWLRSRPASRPAPQGLRPRHVGDAAPGAPVFPQLPHHRSPIPAGPHLLPQREDHRGGHLPRAERHRVRHVAEGGGRPADPRRQSVWNARRGCVTPGLHDQLPVL